MEATLDIHFQIKNAEGASHKKVQIPQTIYNATRFYKQRPIKFTYAIYAPSEIPKDTEAYLKSVLNSFRKQGIDVQILWISVPTV